MKLPISWLKEYVDIGNITPAELADKLLNVGFEVEEIKYLGENISNVRTGKIVKIEKQTRDQLRQHKTGNEMKKYSYLPTLDPDQVYRITTSGRYEKAEILIESSDEFANMLLSYSTEVRGFSIYEE